MVKDFSSTAIEKSDELIKSDFPNGQFSQLPKHCLWLPHLPVLPIGAANEFKLQYQDCAMLYNNQWLLVLYVATYVRGHEKRDLYSSKLKFENFLFYNT